jgi:hypothetical protein
MHTRHSRLSAFAALSLLAASCAGTSPEGDVLDDLRGGASFPLDAYPARCGVALVNSFETPAEIATWHASNWADATLDANGKPLPVSSGKLGVTKGASALSANLRFTGAGYHQGYIGREGLQLSLAGCASLALDVTLPAGAPAGLNGSLVLLLGPSAAWNGQVDPVPLAPGSTVTLRLPLAGGIEPVPARDLFKQLRGVGFRI